MPMCKKQLVIKRQYWPIEISGRKLAPQLIRISELG